MRIATLDLGTNTFLCLVADVEGGEVRRVLSDQARVVRLGQGVDKNRELHPEALARADACLREFAVEIGRHPGVERIIACATSAARDAKNGEELLRIGRKHGFDIEIISGEREAEATYWGAIGGQIDEPVGIIDVGGGSTEFIVGDSSGIRSRLSVDVGSVRLTETFVTTHPIPPSELLAMSDHLKSRLASVKGRIDSGTVGRFIAVAGTPTTVAAIDMAKPFDPHAVHGYRLSVSRLELWLERLAAMTVGEREGLPGMEPKRADVIIAGIMILHHAAMAVGATSLEVSVRGLRYGLAVLAAREGNK